MDYFDLLHQAQINNKNITTNETRCYKTSFATPKKAEKSRVSSDNIKKFLARKEEEEKVKVTQAKRKKEDLLALRALDKKAHKRVQTMLKRTKSANKSVMEDAIDNYNTKDTLEGPQQCDEDDYGYVSQEASAFYEKLMAKYEKDPVEKQKEMTREAKDLKAAKDRVKAALDKEAEEQLHPTRKRKRKHDSDADPTDNEPNEEPEKNQPTPYRPEKEAEKEKPKKIPKKMPPPVDFFELMKIAAKKQHEPILIEKKAEEPEKRPLTKKQKLEMERENERKNRKNKPNVTPPDKQQPSRDESSNKSQAKSKISCEGSDTVRQKTKSDINSNSVNPQPTKTKQVKFNPVIEKSSVHSKNNANDSKERSNHVTDSKPKPQSSAPKSCVAPTKGNPKAEKEDEGVNVSDIDKEIAMLMKRKQMLMDAAKGPKTQAKPGLTQSSKDVSKPSLSSTKTPNSHSTSNLPAKRDSKDFTVSKDKDRMQSKGVNRDKIPQKNISSDREKLHSKVGGEKAQVRSTSSKPGPNVPQRTFSPPRYGPPTKQLQPQVKKKKPPNKRVIDSESEYDSEMDDFIDDGPEEGMNYSQHIKEIFGYDKSRYAQIDEDECVESSFRAQMIEERRSARIGLMEDLEDIQREKEEKARAKGKQVKKLPSKR